MMFPFEINEDQTIWLGLIGSILIHGLVFIFSSTTFIQHAQFSVQPSLQTVEVSIEEMKDTSSVIRTPLDSSVTPQNDTGKKQVAHVKSGVKVKANPDYFQNPSPEYPDLARQMRQEGVVMLVVDVDTKGYPLKVEITQSSGFHLLDQAALKAVSHWKFRPGSIGNISVESSVTVPIRFRLETRA